MPLGKAASFAADRLHLFSNRELGGLILGLAAVNVLGIISGLWLFYKLPNYFGSMGPLIGTTGAAVAVLADVAIGGLALSIIRSARRSQPRPTGNVDRNSTTAAADNSPTTIAVNASSSRERAGSWSSKSKVGSAA